ncbi:MAG: hypothetical protein RSD49_17175 [Hafnia sp.]
MSLSTGDICYLGQFKRLRQQFDGKGADTLRAPSGKQHFSMLLGITPTGTEPELVESKAIEIMDDLGWLCKPGHDHRPQAEIRVGDIGLQSMTKRIWWIHGMPHDAAFRVPKGNQYIVLLLGQIQKDHRLILNEDKIVEMMDQIGWVPKPGHSLNQELKGAA